MEAILPLDMPLEEDARLLVSLCRSASGVGDRVVAKSVAAVEESLLEAFQGDALDSDALQVCGWREWLLGRKHTVCTGCVVVGGGSGGSVGIMGGAGWAVWNEQGSSAAQGGAFARQRGGQRGGERVGARCG